MTAIQSFELSQANPHEVRHFPSRNFLANALHTVVTPNSLPHSSLIHYNGVARDGSLTTKYSAVYRADGIGLDKTAIIGKGGLFTSKEVYAELANATALRGRFVIWADTPVHDVRKDKDLKGKDSIALQIASLLSVIEEVSIPGFADKFNLWGHSFGGLAAGGAAAEMPEKVHATILFQTLFSSKRSKLIRRAPAYTVNNLVPSVVQQVRRGHAELVGPLTGQVVHGFGELARQAWEVPGGHAEEATERMRAVKQKYSVISGDNSDRFLPGREQTVAHTQATVHEIIIGAGHDYPVDNPDQTAAVSLHHFEHLEQLLAKAV